MTQATDRLELGVSTREVLGKKVRFLRREGITPANIYGHGVDSLMRCARFNASVAGHNTMLIARGGEECAPVFVTVA
jgi:hypothetical protein